MSKNYRYIVDKSMTDIELVIDDIESKLVDVSDVLKSIKCEDVSDEVNSKLGTVEEIIDGLLDGLI